jgi:alanine-glyoxylate transaminase/serine-glyoxylate transaminase/serine-pyruvate transaminase
MRAPGERMKNDSPTRSGIENGFANLIELCIFGRSCMPVQEVREEMVVRAGREFLAIPGPTVIPDEVLRAMLRPATDIYSEAMTQYTTRLMADMSALFDTRGRSYIYIGNGHAAWEAALTNVLSRGDKVLVLESGTFAVSWVRTAAQLGAVVETLPGEWNRAVRAEEVEKRLRADKAHEIKAVMLVQVDTASGVVNDVEAIGKAVKASGHPALFMVDAVASLGCVPFRMDAWGIDVAMSASQKGLMGPPGLGFVAANERALEAHQRAGMRSPYWDWTLRDGETHYQKYAGTPPLHLLYALREALDILSNEGLENSHRRHRILGETVRRAVAVWGEKGSLGFNIVNPPERSDTVTNVMVDGFHPDLIRSYAREMCGVILGVGLGQSAGRGFRIAHMGHVNAPTVLGVLGVIETAMGALSVPHGRGGVQAAMDYLGETVRPQVKAPEPVLRAV